MVNGNGRIEILTCQDTNYGTHSYDLEIICSRCKTFNWCLYGGSKMEKEYIGEVVSFDDEEVLFKVEATGMFMRLDRGLFESETLEVGKIVYLDLYVGDVSLDTF